MVDPSVSGHTMIIYNFNDPFSSLWWMYGSVIPQVLPVKCQTRAALPSFVLQSFCFL